MCFCVCVCFCVKNGWTCFILAAENGHFEVVKLLLEKGADVNQASTVCVFVWLCGCVNVLA